MDWTNIQANHGNRKGRSGDIADALSNALAVDYAAIERDCNGTYHLLVDSLISDQFERKEAEAIISLALQAMQTLVSREFSGKTRTGKLPRIAAELAVTAIEVLAEAMPNGRTLQAYRNRHTDFIVALADFAEKVTGEDAKHAGFYNLLGKRVAHAVLEHELVAPQAPDLQPVSEMQYAVIGTAAMEQLVYFIGAGENGPIKIGIAGDPQSRLSTLQTAHHEQLSILAITSGGRDREAEYHARFAAHRLKGEWFARVPDIEAEIVRLQEEV